MRVHCHFFVTYQVSSSRGCLQDRTTLPSILFRLFLQSFLPPKVQPDWTKQVFHHIPRINNKALKNLRVAHARVLIQCQGITKTINPFHRAREGIKCHVTKLNFKLVDMCHSFSHACCIAKIWVPLCLKKTIKKKKKTLRKQQKEPFHQKENLS